MTVVKVVYRKEKTNTSTGEEKPDTASSSSRRHKKPRRYSKPERTPEEIERGRKIHEEAERNRLAKLERKRLHKQREENRKAHLRVMEEQKEAKRRRREKAEKERKKKQRRTQEGLELLAGYFPELAAPTVSFQEPDIWIDLKAKLKDRAHAENWSKRHTKRQFRRLKLGLGVWLTEQGGKNADAV